MDDSSLFLFEYGANLFQQVYLVQALFEHTLQVCVWMGSDGLLEGAPHQEGSRGLYQGPGLVPEEPVPGGNVLHPKSRFGKILTKNVFQWHTLFSLDRWGGKDPTSFF